MDLVGFNQFSAIEIWVPKAILVGSLPAQCESSEAKSLQKKPNIAHPYSPLMTLQDCPGMISLQFKIAFFSFHLFTESHIFWLQYADFFDWPHLQYFDSVEQLQDTFNSSQNLTIVSQKMLQEVESRRFETNEKWCTLLKS